MTYAKGTAHLLDVLRDSGNVLETVSKLNPIHLHPRACFVSLKESAGLRVWNVMARTARGGSAETPRIFTFQEAATQDRIVESASRLAVDFYHSSLASAVGHD